MNKNISKIKRFFWLISGSEISTLEKCPADYNRHMNIGLAIFVTSLIAFFTGSLAGFRFGSQNIISALVFGAIWSLLVFTIDRNMVSTLQKNPDDNNRKLVFAVLYRGFLSLLIAFFIAIPLELLIFEQEIAKQMKSDNETEVINQRNIEKNIYNISDLEQRIENYSEEQEKLDSLLNRGEPPTGYRNYSTIKSEMQKAKSDYESKRDEYYKKVALRKKYYDMIPEYHDTLKNANVQDKNSIYYQQWQSLWISTGPDGYETKSLKHAQDEFENLEKKVVTVQEDYFKEINDKKKRVDSLNIVKSNELAMNSDSVNIKTIEHENFVTSQKGFIKQWIALNNVSGFWVTFFIWFIRSVFFVIEMLPTLTKVLTPLSSYDIKIYYLNKKVESNSEYEMNLLKKMQEKKMELSVNTMTKIEEQKLEHELKLQEGILNNLAKKQNSLANSIIKEWEKRQKENAQNDLSEFINENES